MNYFELEPLLHIYFSSMCVRQSCILASRENNFTGRFDHLPDEHFQIFRLCDVHVYTLHIGIPIGIGHCGGIPHSVISIGINQYRHITLDIDYSQTSTIDEDSKSAFLKNLKLRNFKNS